LGYCISKENSIVSILSTFTIVLFIVSIIIIFTKLLLTTDSLIILKNHKNHKKPANLVFLF